MHPLLPLPALIAEIEAYPFSALSAHRLRVMKLSMHPEGVFSSDIEELAIALVEWLRQRSGGMSLASLRLLVAHVWFAEHVNVQEQPRATAGQKSLPLARFAAKIASRYLECNGNRVQLQCSTDRPEHAASFRWLTMFLPQDFLIAALAAKDHLPEPPCEFVRLVSPQLSAVLDQGCAETHLHRGAAIPFSQLWSGILRSLSVSQDIDFSRLQSQSTERSWADSLLFQDGPTGIELSLLAVAISRIVLAAFLCREHSSERPGSLSDFLSKSGRGTLSSICSQFPWSQSYRNPSAAQSCVDAVRHVCFGQAPKWYRPIWHSLHRMLRGAWKQRSIRHDPLDEWLIPQAGIGDTETRFTHRCLRYLLSPAGSADSWFNLVFFQYVRTRCSLYQMLVQVPGSAGLDYFVHYFNRISPLRLPLEDRLFEIALQTESRDLRLTSLEIRRSPSRHWHEVRDAVREVADGGLRHQAHGNESKPEVGLVLHFVKQHETKRAGRRFLYADPNSVTAPARHGLWFQDRWAEASAIGHNLRLNPEHLLLLRGIDVANTELAQPTWTLIPLWQKVWASAREASAILAVRRPSWAASSIRSTIHVGEDFVRLTQGLRRIHEPIEYGLLRVGDRIGHGLALGIDPKQWASQLHQTPETLDERLDDLLWELERYQKQDLPVEAQRLEYVRVEIMRLASGQYAGTRGLSVDDLITARRLRHQAGLLKRLRYPYLSADRKALLPQEIAYELLWRYLTDPLVFQRGQQTLLIRADEAEQRFLTVAQRWLRTVIGRLELTIESNPSSNLLIGAFHSLETLPVLRLSPLEQGETATDPPVLVSINTDNPITFASCLADEMVHVYYSMLRRGIQSSVALAWLDRFRRHGLQSRFTLPASRNDQALRTVRSVGQLPYNGRPST